MAPESDEMGWMNGSLLVHLRWLVMCGQLTRLQISNCSLTSCIQKEDIGSNLLIYNEADS